MTDDSLRCKLTLKDGTVLEFELPTERAAEFMDMIDEVGFHDDSTDRFYPTDALHQIEVWNPNEDENELMLWPFSLN